jgi:hypothetical protein
MKTSRNPWPYGILAVFGLFFAGMATAVIIACTHRDSLVSEDYYEQELKYQSQINAAALAERSGAGIRVDASSGILRVTVPAAQVHQKFSGKISFYRANDPKLDREFNFAPGADGAQLFNGANFAAGLWRVRVVWQAGGQDYFLEQRVTL